MRAKRENFFIGVGQILNILVLGLTAFAFAFSYAKRKTDSYTKLIVSLVITFPFVSFTLRNYWNYSAPLDEHPVVLGEFIFSGILCVLIGIQLYRGIVLDKDVISSNARTTSSKRPSPTASELDKPTKTEDEIF